MISLKKKMEQEIFVLTFTGLRDRIIKDEAGQKKIKNVEVATGVKTKKFRLDFSNWLLVERCNYIYDLGYYKEKMKYSKETLFYFRAIPNTIEDVYLYFLAVSVISTNADKTKEIDLFCATKGKGTILIQYIFNSLYPNEKIWTLTAANDDAKGFWEKQKFAFGLQGYLYSGIKGAPADFWEVLTDPDQEERAEEYLEDPEFVKTVYAQKKLRLAVEHLIKKNINATRTFELLLKNIGDHKDFYPIHMCIREISDACPILEKYFEICLKYFDVNQPDDKGIFPLELAVIKYYHSNILYILLNHKTIKIHVITTRTLTLDNEKNLTFHHDDDDSFVYYDEIGDSKLYYWDLKNVMLFLNPKNVLHKSITSDYLRKIRDKIDKYIADNAERKNLTEVINNYIRQKDNSRTTGGEEPLFKFKKEKINLMIPNDRSCILCTVLAIQCGQTY